MSVAESLRDLLIANAPVHKKSYKFCKGGSESKFLFYILSFLMKLAGIYLAKAH